MTYVHAVDAYEFVDSLEDGSVRLMLTDPPYFGIVNDSWDNQWGHVEEFALWLSGLFLRAYPKLTPDGSLVFFGAMGKHGQHPLFRIVERLERGELTTALDFESRKYFFRDWLTWRKRRAYGTDRAYLYIREEILWFSKSPDKWVFHKPYTSEIRGYSGFNPEYKAHSEFKRVGNVIDDINELFRPERVCQKPLALMKRFVETHSDEGDLVVDPFVGWGSTGVAAVQCKRRFLGSEKIETDALKANERIAIAASSGVVDMFS